MTDDHICGDGGGGGFVLGEVDGLVFGFNMGGFARLEEVVTK